MPEDLAVFIDWENIYISTVTEYKSKPNVSAILEKAREYGRIVSATAYADWTDGDFRQAPPTLYSNGISPRYISARYFPGGKSQKRRTNSIDVMLAVECSDFLHNHPQVDTYVLVTGDGDFIPLVSLLRSKGKNVVVIGVSEATSYHLIESADHFVSYASLLEEDRAARAQDREPKREAADPYEELVRAVQALKKGGKTRVLGQVKQQMIVQLGSFDERNAGFKKFKDFVVEAERRGLVNTVDQDLELQVYLPDEKVPDLQETDLAAEEPTSQSQIGKSEQGQRQARARRAPARRAGTRLRPPRRPHALRAQDGLHERRLPRTACHLRGDLLQHPRSRRARRTGALAGGDRGRHNRHARRGLPGQGAPEALQTGEGRHDLLRPERGQARGQERAEQRLTLAIGQRVANRPACRR